MRMTPARRDFLRLTIHNDLLVKIDKNRFITYRIPGQLKKRQSAQNFNLFLEFGYLYSVPNNDPDYLRYKPTARTFNLFGELK